MVLDQLSSASLCVLEKVPRLRPLMHLVWMNPEPLSSNTARCSMAAVTCATVVVLFMKVFRQLPRPLRLPPASRLLFRWNANLTSSMQLSQLILSQLPESMIIHIFLFKKKTNYQPEKKTQCCFLFLLFLHRMRTSWTPCSFLRMWFEVAGCPQISAHSQTGRRPAHTHAVPTPHWHPGQCT